MTSFQHQNSNSQYLIKETDRAIMHLLQSGEAVFYEHDRDGNERYEPHLRYHDPELISWWAYHLDKEED